MIVIAAFAVSFCYVGLKAFQQLNVALDRARWVMPTSMAMAFCEVFIVVQVANQGAWWIALPIGTGAGLGCLAAMALHKRMRR